VKTSSTAPVAVRALLEGVLDFAGTFPPAGLTLADAVSDYARDRLGPHAWLLGRFVVAANGLRDIERLGGFRSEETHQWRLTVVLPPNPGPSLADVEAFNRERAQRGDSAMACVKSVEFPPLAPDDIRAYMSSVPEGVEAFFETPLDDIERRLAAVADAKAMAKVRTGGLMAGAIPSAEGLARFMTSCSDAGLAFKATAGLHHAVRGSYALTYEPGSPTGTLHGFLNVAVASALVYGDADPAEVIEALAETSAERFKFNEKGLTWRDRKLSIADLTGSRKKFFRSFGSCAFGESVGELEALKLL
jgi:hypothetical protein